LIPEWLDGEAYIPGTREEIAARQDTCEGDVPRAHSHFFTAAGRFGSRDRHGATVDSGNYVMLDETHFDEGCRELLAYAIAVAYPGLSWHRQSEPPGTNAAPANGSP
jgi:hypothetical protein